MIMENKNVTSIALHKDFINKITLHNTEYYDAIEDGVIADYEKLHSKGDIKYEHPDALFFRGKKLGVYETDVYTDSRYGMINTRRYTIDDIIDKIKTNLEAKYGVGHVNKTDKTGVLEIHPHIVIECMDEEEEIILSFDEYYKAQNKFNDITIIVNDVVKVIMRND